MLGIRLTASANGENQPRLADGAATWILEAASDAGFPVMIFAPEQRAICERSPLRYPELRLISII